MISRKARLEFLALLILAGLGLAFRHPGFLLLSIPLVWHFTLGLSLMPRNPRESLLVQREVWPRRISEGERVQVTVEVKNIGKQKVSLFVRDGPYPRFPVSEGTSWALGTLKPGESLTIAYKSQPLRGLHRLHAVAAEVRDPLGLALEELEFPCLQEVLVLPRYENLSRLELAARRTLPMPGTARARRGGIGLEFFGVREYRPGDEGRRLAWKAYARRGEPVVVEYEQERAADVAVILDVRARAYRGAPPELFDHAVRAAAALAHYHLRQGHRVGLLKYGAVLAWLFPGYGRRHGEKILRELAQAELGESEVFAELAHLPTRLLPTGSLLLFVSPLLFGDEETLGKLVARGYRVLVVLPDPASLTFGRLEKTWEAEVARQVLTLERWALLRRTQRSGVAVVVWDVRRPLAGLVRKLRVATHIWR
ncbi:MAG: DUF58 domain-containing protein [Candidatus Bipolaricaulota bacterium]|nr:DUF58 domain-containing protein [Candidatus Bipolaricaulota bacterium]MDW8127179.1 DUF58 domain-containing protein [Candidatus Bipolaricaulota bacterium]